MRINKCGWIIEFPLIISLKLTQVFPFFTSQYVIQVKQKHSKSKGLRAVSTNACLKMAVQTLMSKSTEKSAAKFITKAT